MITDYFMITEKCNRIQVLVITDYDYPNSASITEVDRMYSSILELYNGRMSFCRQ